MNHVKNNNCEKKNFFNSNLFLILAISFSVLVIGGVIKAGSKETIPIYVYWPYEKRDNYSNVALNSKIKIVGRQYKGYSGSLPINVLNLPFGSFNNSCTRDSFGYAVIGTGCGFGTETIDSTHGYFKY